MSLATVNGRLIARARNLPARGFLMSMGSSASRLLIQLGQFVLVARSLGPADYGPFAALVGFCVSLSALAGWGAGTLYVRDIARRGVEHDLGLLARSLWMFAPSSLLLAAAMALGFGLFGAHLDPSAVAMIVVADLVFGGFVQVTTRILLASDQFSRLAVAEFTFSGSRLLAALAFVGIGGSSVDVWAWFYFGASAVAAAVCFVLIDGARAAVTRPSWAGNEFRDGFAFAFGQGAQQARRNLDKPLALAALGPELAGVYAAASRFVEAALLPVFSVLRVTHRRFFSAATQSWDAVRQFLLTMLPLIALVGITLAASLVGLAFFVEALLGPAYAGTAPILIGLALLPGLNGASAVASDALSARNRQAWRLFVEASGCALKATLCLGLGHAFGMPGFIAAVVATDATVAAVLLVLALYRRQLASTVIAVPEAGEVGGN